MNLTIRQTQQQHPRQPCSDAVVVGRVVKLIIISDGANISTLLMMVETNFG